MKTKTILQSKATKPQYDFVNCGVKFPALVAGYGSGKTEAAIKRILKLKFENPNANVAYYLPSYDLVKMIAFPRFCGTLQNAGIQFTLNKSDHTITIPNKGKIIFRSLDNAEKIIGYEVSDSIVDELDTLPTNYARECWEKIIGRNRAPKANGKHNTVGVVTTPEGFKFTYDRWVLNKTEDYQIITASTYSNARNLPEGYIGALKSSYPAHLINAYLDGNFVNMTSGCVFPNFSRDLNTSTTEIMSGEILSIGMDFNVHNCSGSVSVMRGDDLHIVDEFVGVLDTPTMCKIIKEKYPDHRIIVYPDASGKHTSSTNASVSDLNILRGAGFEVRARDSNPRVRDRINATLRMICDGDNVRKLFIHPRCTETIMCFEQLSYDKNGNPDKSSGKDHLIDASTYPIAYMFPIIITKEVQKIIPIPTAHKWR